MNIFSLLGACVLASFSAVSGFSKKYSSIDRIDTEYHLKLDSSQGNHPMSWYLNENLIDTDYRVNMYNIQCWGASGWNPISAHGTSTNMLNTFNDFVDNRLTTTNFYFGVFEIACYNYNYLFCRRFYFINATMFVNSTYYITDNTWLNYIDIYNANPTYSKVFGKWFSLFDADISSTPYLNTASTTDNGYSVYARLDDFTYYMYALSYRDGSPYLNGVEPQRQYGSTYTVIGANSQKSGQNLGSKYTFLPCYYFYAYNDSLNASGIMDFDISIHGYSSDWNTAYTNGYNDGFESGNSEGQATGYSEGFHDGELRGYDEGYTAGVNSPTYSFASLFGSIADTPVLIVRKLFDFDLFGVSALTVILSCFTALIVLYIFRKLV